MLFNTRGIVLKITRFKESSAIIQIYTDLFGQKTYIINGVFSKSTGNKAAYYQPMNLLDLVVYNKPNANINRVKEQKIASLYTNIPFNFQKRTIVQLLNEILLKSIKEEEDNPELFDFLFNSLILLDQQKSSKHFLILFLLKLSVYLGFGPYNNFSSKNMVFDIQQGLYTGKDQTNVNTLNPQLSALLSQYLNTDPSLIDHINATRADRKMLIEGIIRYYQFHITNFGNLRSLEVFSQIFDELTEL